MRIKLCLSAVTTAHELNYLLNGVHKKCAHRPKWMSWRKLTGKWRSLNDCMRCTHKSAQQTFYSRGEPQYAWPDDRREWNFHIVHSFPRAPISCAYERVLVCLGRGVQGVRPQWRGDRCQPGSRRQPSPRCSFVCATNLLLLGSLEIKRGEVSGRKVTRAFVFTQRSLAHILVSSPARRRGGIQKSLDERASLSQSQPHLCARFIYISARAVQTGSARRRSLDARVHLTWALSRRTLSHLSLSRICVLQSLTFTQNTLPPA